MEHGDLLASLRNTGEYSDLTVLCGGYRFQVHKNVMCLRSKWFAEKCQEEKWAEGKPGVIPLRAIESQAEEEDYRCDHPEAVQLMIDYIYLNDYTPGSSDAQADTTDHSQLAMKVPTQDTKLIDKSDIEDVAEKSGCATQTDEGFWASCAKKAKKKNKASLPIRDEPPTELDYVAFAEEPAFEPEPVATQADEECIALWAPSARRAKKKNKASLPMRDEPVLCEPDYVAVAEEPAFEPEPVPEAEAVPEPEPEPEAAPASEPEPVYDSNGASKSSERELSGTPPTSPAALTMHARLYAMGSKYGIEPLRQLAIKKIKDAVEGTWDLSDFAGAILVAFKATEDSDLDLRDVIIKIILDYAATMSTDPVIEKSIVAVEGLSFKLFRKQSLRKKQSKRRVKH